MMNAPAFTLRAAFGSLSRSARLAAVLALGAGEAGEEILMSAAALTLRAACGSLSRSARIVHAAEQIDGAVGLLALAGSGEFDGGDDVDEFAEALVILRCAQALRCGCAWGEGAAAPGSVEAGAGVVLGEDAFEARVVALDGDHGVVHSLADGGLLGAGLEVGPAGIGGHPKDVLGFVFVRVFGIGAGVVALAGEELGAVFLEGVGDVFEEDEAEDDVLIFRRVHVVAELVGGEPELGLEADGGGGVFRAVGFCAGHN